MQKVVTVQEERKVVDVYGPYSSSNQVPQSLVEDAVAQVLDDFEVPLTVKDFGAIGDGFVDDTAAIQLAIDTIGEGGVVYFPPGQYRTTAPIKPLRQQIIRGSHANKYSADKFPYVLCSIKGDPEDFVGDSIIKSEPYSYGVELRNLAIIGTGEDDPNIVHGVYFGPMSESSGERAWNIKDCLISSCSGDGIAGHMWVFDMRDTHIAQCRIGLHTFDDDGLLDTRIIGCNIYFNRDGGIVLDGGWTGAIEIIGTRLERSGNEYGYPSTPVNPNAPGLRIRRGKAINIVAVSTDANTGHGFHIGNYDAYVYDITITACTVIRDGGGTQQTFEWRKWIDGVSTLVPAGTADAEAVSTEGYSAIFLERCFYPMISNVICEYGRSEDGASWADAPISPQYGITVKDTGGVHISSTRCEMMPIENSLQLLGTNYQTHINLPWLPGAGSPSMTLGGKPTEGKVISFANDGVTRWRTGMNPDAYSANYYVARFDVDGNYIDSPQSFNLTTGGVETKQSIVSSIRTDVPALQVNSPTGQTSNLVNFNVDWGTLAGIRNDGRVFGADGVSSNDFVTVGQLASGGGGDVNVAQLTGSETQGKITQYRTRNSVTDAITLLWEQGVNPPTYGNTWHINRFDATGTWVDDPLSINYATGRVNLNYSMIQNKLDPTNTVLYIRSTDPLQTGPLIDAAVDGVTQFKVSATGQVTAAAGTSAGHLVTKDQLDTAVAGASGFTGGDVTGLDIVRPNTNSKRIGFKTDTTLKWELGVNPEANGDTFYVFRTDGTGAHLDSPLTLSYANGRMQTKNVLVTPSATDIIPLAVGGPAGLTSDIATFGVDGVTLAAVEPDGQIRAVDGTASNHLITKSQLDATNVKTLVDAKGDLLVGTADNTVARKAASTISGAGLRVDPSSPDGLGWMPTSPPHTVGRIKCITGWSQYQTTTGGDDQNRMVIWPFMNETSMTISDIAMRMTSGTASLVYRIGFYLLDGTDGTPYTLIGDCGTFNASSGGIKQISSLSVALPFGLIGIAMVAQGAGGASGFQSAITGVMSTQSDFSRLGSGWTQTGVTGALPATATVTDYDPYGPPAIWAKRSA